jgi:serine/threonine-protein kinase
MGDVWKARDTRLGRIVAIKKVKEQHSERFKQEARSIAALNHPNICQLHDVGPDYLVLEYVEGKPLSSPLPEREAVRLAIQIATALEEAHRNGIIHRDLKPSNIMVTDKGSVKLLDFGLAKLYEQSAGESTAEFPATQVGAVLGTVAYMSPEQAQGQPVDARSDIFSFGLVLYEMLSGRRAFSGDTPLVIGSALMKEEPPPLKASPLLEKIVSRCLAKQPSARYQTISEVKKALEQVLAEKAAQPAAESQPSIAVLPFLNMSGDKEQAYFSDGLAEEIINALTQIPGLKVIARTSSFAFRGREQDIRRIAEALTVTNILEGSVRTAGNRIRVTAQLINAADGSHLWSQRYDRELSDVFAIQDEISQAIAEKLRVSLSTPGPLVKRYTDNVEAYSLYLRGHYQAVKNTLDGTAKGKEYFQQAISIDPDYALAWYGLGFIQWEQAHLGVAQPEEAYLHSLQAVEKALRLDEMLSEAHALMAVLRACEFDWSGARDEFQRALELDPKSTDALFWYSWFYLIPMRRLQEAVATLKKALELDPLSAFLQWALGYGYLLARDWHRCISQTNNAVELDPDFSSPFITLGNAYLFKGEFDQAIRALEMATKLSGSSPLILGYLGFTYAHTGRKDTAHKLLQKLEDQAQKSYTPFSSVARICLGLGEIDKCLDWFEKAVSHRESAIGHFHLEPACDPLRSHPRYHALLRKMNLEA